MLTVEEAKERFMAAYPDRKPKSVRMFDSVYVFDAPRKEKQEDSKLKQFNVEVDTFYQVDPKSGAVETFIPGKHNMVEFVKTKPTILEESKEKTNEVKHSDETQDEDSKWAEDLSKNKYGIPKLKKYPMPDADHVRSAVRFFNYVSPTYEEELAKNINARIAEYGIKDLQVGEGNRFLKYYKKPQIEVIKHSDVLDSFFDFQSDTSSYYDSNDVTGDYLEHWGIKGMHWGDRRYQNSDGSLTPAGRVRYGVGDARTAKMDKYFKGDSAEPNRKGLKTYGKKMSIAARKLQHPVARGVFTAAMFGAIVAAGGGPVLGAAVALPGAIGTTTAAIHNYRNKKAVEFMMDYTAARDAKLKGDSPDTVKKKKALDEFEKKYREENPDYKDSKEGIKEHRAAMDKFSLNYDSKGSTEASKLKSRVKSMKASGKTNAEIADALGITDVSYYLYQSDESSKWYTANDTTDEFLEHWGIKNMHWGQRRFQNSDGSLTPAGRLRYGVGAPRIGSTLTTGAAPSKAKKKPKPKTFDQKYKKPTKTEMAAAVEKYNAKHNTGYSVDQMIFNKNGVHYTANGDKFRRKGDKKFLPFRGKWETKAEPKKFGWKPVDQMSSDEIKEELNRKALEKEYKQKMDPNYETKERMKRAVLDAAANGISRGGASLIGDAVDTYSRYILNGLMGEPYTLKTWQKDKNNNNDGSDSDGNNGGNGQGKKNKPKNGGQQTQQTQDSSDTTETTRTNNRGLFSGARSRAEAKAEHKAYMAKMAAAAETYRKQEEDTSRQRQKAFEKEREAERAKKEAERDAKRHQKEVNQMVKANTDWKDVYYDRDISRDMRDYSTGPSKSSSSTSMSSSNEQMLKNLDALTKEAKRNSDIVNNTDDGFDDLYSFFLDEEEKKRK